MYSIPTEPVRMVFDNINVSNKQTRIEFLTILIRRVNDNISVTNNNN